MIILVLGIVAGILIGYFLPIIDIPAVYNRFISVSFLAGLDSVMGAWRAGLEGRFCLRTFIVGFSTNALLAAFLTYTGDRLGVDFYLAAIVTFGVRVFTNAAAIRRIFLDRIFPDKKETVMADY